MYNLKINKKQLTVIELALDLYSRIQMGQLSQLLELSNENNVLYNKVNKDNIDSVKYVINQLKILLFPELDYNNFYGIFSDKVPENSKIAYDIIKVIENKLNSNSVCNVLYSQKPLTASKLKLPIITNIKD